LKSDIDTFASFNPSCKYGAPEGISKGAELSFKPAWFSVGVFEGVRVGAVVGYGVGAVVGKSVGAGVGKGVGYMVGERVGFAVG
jgi:hypothetical protein